MAEYATKEDVGRIENEIQLQRKVTQDLITVVAKGTQAQDSFMKFQEKLNEDLRKVIKEANEATCGKIKELKEDVTVRLNKHSERLDENQKDHADFKTKDATLVEKVKSEAKDTAKVWGIVITVIGAICSFGLTLLWNELKKGGS